ncbi:MAG: WG repeat-containing protein [Muribaculaceae bacterium]
MSFEFLKIGNYESGFSLIKPSGEYVLRGEYGEHISGEGRVLKANKSQRQWLLDSNGYVLIDDAKKIEKIADGYEVTKTTGNVGLYSEEGECIISPDLGYNSFSLFTGPQKTKYYKVKETISKNYGIINTEGNEILPCEFEDIDYIGGDFFKFRSGGAWGVVSIVGKVIIPTSRGYTSIGKYSTIQKTIPYTMDGYKGECNSLGRQITKIRDSKNIATSRGTEDEVHVSHTDGNSKTIATSNTQNYSEYTREFFSTPKSYSIESHTLKMLGPSGVTQYKPGESSFSVTSNGFTYKFKDGSGSSRKITSPLKNVTVLTSKGDIQMQMYILDNGIAVRVIRYNDGHCVVYQYVLNNSTGKYITYDWFTLRK